MIHVWRDTGTEFFVSRFQKSLKFRYIKKSNLYFLKMNKSLIGLELHNSEQIIKMFNFGWTNPLKVSSLAE